MRQGFLYCRNRQMVLDETRILLRGFGLGGWLLPEGYMWQMEGDIDRPRRMEQLGQQQLAAAVLLPAVILGLDPAAGAADQLAAGLEGGAGIVKQGKFGGDQGSSPCHETVA